MKEKKRVVVGLSGGVDSTVAAYLLTRQGYDVTGIFMKNWHDSSVTISGDCPWKEDSTDAMLVAHKLGIPFYVLDFSKVYYERIVQDMFSQYQSGRTPNPDILCNREIKFDVFMDAALKLGADYVATGHYCIKEGVRTPKGTEYRLIEGADPNKDQSYFLCQLNQKQLACALFPIGSLRKDEVREIARKEGFVTAGKKDSQGLCFVGKVKLPDFLQQKLKPEKGDTYIIPREACLNNGSSAFHSEIEKLSPELLRAACLPPVFSSNQGRKAGTHNGAHFFTIGQRKGLDIGGSKKPLYVISTDTLNNIVYAGEGSDHPGLLRYGLFIQADDIHWIRETYRMKPGDQVYCKARIRHRQPLAAARLIMKAGGLYVLFEKGQRGIAPGQFAAFYSKIDSSSGNGGSGVSHECTGSGVIAATSPPL